MIDFCKSQRKWYVIIAKSIHYKKAAEIFDKLGVLCYIPLQRQLHYWSDRKKWVDVPILNPYIFLFTNESEKRLIFQSSHSFHFVNLAGKPAVAKEEEIEKVKLLCSYSANMKMEHSPKKRGDMVEVTSGPFSGMNGYILQENGRHRFLVQIESLGQFASVDIESSWLKTYPAK